MNSAQNVLGIDIFWQLADCSKKKVYLYHTQALNVLFKKWSMPRVGSRLAVYLDKSERAKSRSFFHNCVIVLIQNTFVCFSLFVLVRFYLLVIWCMLWSLALSCMSNSKKITLVWGKRVLWTTSKRIFKHAFKPLYIKHFSRRAFFRLMFC